MKTTITIKDIAEQLNISRNTVAKALNGKYVPEKTRLLVLNKAKELNYKQLSRANLGEQETAKKHYRILLLSGKPLNDISFFIPIMKGIENYCFVNHHELFQYAFNEREQTFSSFSSYIQALNVDGIIAIECFDPDFIVKLLNRGIPTCFIDFSSKTPVTLHQYDVVGTNNFKPIFDLTTRLINDYRIKNFCFVGDNRHCLSFQERYLGMINALALKGIPHSPGDDILRHDNFNYGNAAAIKTEILKLKNLPQCFICSNDFIARSTCNALKSIGLSIPQQCMVVGYDNVSESYSVAPTITSFSCSNEYLGREAICTLLNRIASPNDPSRTIQVSAHIIERTSTNRPLPQ